MRSGGWWRMAAMAALLTACGSSPTPVAGVSISPTFPATATPTAPGVCDASHRCLALVTLRGSDQIVIRDITDIGNPKTVGATSLTATRGSVNDWLGQLVSRPVFRDAHFVTYHDGQDMWATGAAASPARLGNPYGGIQMFAWSPDGTAIVFNHGDAAANSPTDIALLKPPHWFKPIGSIPALGGGGCESYASCNIPNFLDARFLYSPDGARISLVVNSFGGSVFRVWTSDGSLVKSDDGRGWTMSVWSGSGLYFRGSEGVRVMRGGSTSAFLPGVQWIKPSASPAGEMIAYSARDSEGWAHTFVVDTATGKVRELNKARTDAVFLTSRYIWYEGERACVASENCGSSPAIHPLSGKTYIYDLQDGTETESLITAVYDVWPHAA